MQGKTILHYKILEKVGGGGMGDVYAAEDTKLHRKVAIKMLPPEVASNPERRARFEREATAVAALNHPNIVTIHSIEEADGVAFMAMELVQGEPLSALIPKRGFAASKFFDLAIPLADAVAAAHMQGITHRDLKPDNVMVAGDGRVKVLDFGLAKLKESPAGGGAGTDLPTRKLETEQGVVMGTVAYMSPEQAEGKSVDPRSDVFSLGILLYEMATGQRPFKGDTKVSIISSILRDTPDSVTDLAGQMPRHLSRIIKRCLAKDPLRRYQTALEVRNELEELRKEIESGESLPAAALAAAGKAPGRRMLPIYVAAGAVVVIAAIYLLVPRGKPSEQKAEAPIGGTFTRITATEAPENSVSLSADGKSVAYAGLASGNWDIYVQRVGGQNALDLTKDYKDDDVQPAFSPDGEKIAFRSDRDGGGIFVMGATGESVRRLTDSGCNPSWSPDGKEIAYTLECFQTPMGRQATSSMWVVEEATGKSRKVFGGDAVQPSWSPHGDRIAYWGIPEGSGQRDIWTIRPDGTAPVAVTDDAAVDWNPVWSPDGAFLYFVSDRGGAMNIWRVAIDEASGAPQGPPQQVTTGVSSWSQNPSLSADGKRMAYVSSNSFGSVERIAFDPRNGGTVGQKSTLTRASGITQTCEVSPDGAWLVCEKSGGQEDIVLMASDGGETRNLTNDPFKDRLPRWSPDGKTIAFYSDRNGGYEIWTIRPDGSDLHQVTSTPGMAVIFPVWSPDGTKLLAQDLQSGYRGLYDAKLDAGAQKPEKLDLSIGDAGVLVVHAWSREDVLAGSFARPDGTYGGVGVYDLKHRGGRILEKKGGGANWLADGERLLYSHDNVISILDTRTGKSREILRVAPADLVFRGVSLPGDGSFLYYSLTTTEADVWLLDMK